MNFERNSSSIRRCVHLLTICLAPVCVTAQQDADSAHSPDSNFKLTGTMISSADEARQKISFERPRLWDKPFENIILVKHRLHYVIDIEGFYEHKPSTTSTGTILSLNNPDSHEWVMLVARERPTLPEPFQAIEPIDIHIENNPILHVQVGERSRSAEMNGWKLHGKMTINNSTMDVSGWMGQGERYDYALYHLYPEGSAAHKHSNAIIDGLQQSNAYATTGSILSLLMPKSLNELDWSPYGFTLKPFASDTNIVSDKSAHDMGIVAAEIHDDNDFWGIQAYCHGNLEITPVAIATAMTRAVEREYPKDPDKVDYMEWNQEKLLRIRLQSSADGETYWYESITIPGEYCSQQIFASSNDGIKQTSQILRDILSHYSRSKISGSTPFNLTHAHKYLFNHTGIYYYDQGDYATASTYFAESVRLDPDDDQIVENWLTALSYAGSYQDGIYATDIVSSARPLSLVEKSWKYYFQYMIEDYVSAAEGYLSIFQQGYDNIDDLLIYMDLLTIENKYDELLIFIDQYKDLFDDSSDYSKAKIGSYYASSLLHTNQAELALEAIDMAINKLGEKSLLIEVKILILEEQNNLIELRRLAEDLIGRGVASASVYYSLALAEYQQLHYQKANDYLAKAVTLEPDNVQYSEDLMTVSSMIGQGDLRLLSDDPPQLMLPKSWDFTAARITRQIDADYQIDKMYKLIHFVSGEKLVKTYYMDYVIHSETGAETLNTLNFTFDPLNEQIGVNTLAVYDQEGRLIAEGDRNTYYIKDESSSEANFSKSLYIPIPKTGPGRRIQLILTVTSQQDSKHFDYEEIQIGASRSVAHAGIWFTGDVSSVRYRSYKAGDPDISHDGLLWQLTDVPAYRDETMAADPLYEIPRVTLVGRDQTWNSIGMEYYSSIQSLLGYDEGLQSLVDSIAPEELPITQRMEKISEYVQQSISYTAIEFGARGYTPKSAEVTLSDRYGDCKDHAVILHAMLDAAGIQNRLVLVNLDQQVSPDMPSLDQFDHMIVEAATAEGTYYLDATDKNLPLLRYPPRHLAGNMGLALGANPEQVYLPSYPPDSRYVASERIIKLDNNGFMSVSETLTANGYAAAAYRGDLSSRTNQSRRDRIQEYLNGNGNHLKLKGLTIKNIESIHLPLVMEIEYETSAIPIHLPSIIPDLPSIFEQQWILPTWYENRQTEFKIGYPLQFKTEITLIDQTSSNRFAGSLDTISMQSEFGEWQLTATPATGKLKIQFEYREKADVYGAEHYDDYEAFSSTAVRVLGNAARFTQSSPGSQINTSR